jgi:hypothetical protein
LQFNVDAVAANAKSAGSFEPVKPGDTAPGRVTAKAGVAYLAPWGTSASARLMTGSLREGLRVLSADRPFTQNGRAFPAGTLIFMVKENGPGLHDSIQTLAETSGAEVIATDSSWVDQGPDFGSSRVVMLRRPSLLIAWDRPASAGSDGQARWVLEREYGYPTTVIRTTQLGTADLSKFQVIILPEGNNADLGANGARRLRDWVQSGGTLIGIGSAVSFLSANSMPAISPENAPSVGPASSPVQSAGGRGASTSPAAPAEGRGATATPDRVPGHIYATETEFEKAIRPDTQAPWPAHGFLAKAKVESHNWITAGVPATVYALVSGSAIYTPIKADRGTNAVICAGPETVMASGYSWDEFRKQLAFKPLLRHPARRPRQRHRLHLRPQLPRLHGRPQPPLPQRRLPRSRPHRRLRLRRRVRQTGYPAQPADFNSADRPSDRSPRARIECAENRRASPYQSTSPRAKRAYHVAKSAALSPPAA